MKQAFQLLQRGFRLLRERPSQTYSTVRCYFWFLITSNSYRFFSNPRVVRGQNVRIQRRGSLMAEAPYTSITIGDNSIVYEGATLAAYGSGAISIGRDSIIGRTQIFSRESVTIGDRFLSSWNVLIQDFDPHPLLAEDRARQVQSMVYGFQPTLDGGPIIDKKKGCHLTETNGPYESTFRCRPIRIGNDVWVGANAIILKGAVIGDGSIVAAGAVVPSGEYPPKSIISGNPAKATKQIQTGEKSDLRDEK